MASIGLGSWQRLALPPDTDGRGAIAGGSFELNTGSRWLLGEKRQHLPWLILRFWNAPPVLTVAMRCSVPSGELGCCGTDICWQPKGKKGEAGPGAAQGGFRVWTCCLRRAPHDTKTSPHSFYLLKRNHPVVTPGVPEGMARR